MPLRFPPSDHRKFSGRRYKRLYSTGNISNRSHNALGILAAHVRTNGFNARVVKNRTSASVYIEPRIYNAPIPEVDQLRQQTFPTAMRQAFRNDPIDDDDRINKQYANIVASQVKEIKDIRKEASGLDASIQDTYDEMSTQALRWAGMVESYGPASDMATFSNLTEDQWKTLSLEPRIFTGLETITNKNKSKVAQALGEIAYLNGAAEISSGGPDQQFTVKELENSLHGLFDEENVMIRTFSDEYVSTLQDSIGEWVVNQWKQELIKTANEMGISEQALYAYVATGDEQARLEEIKSSMNWKKWDGWDGSSPPDTYSEVPSALTLPTIEIKEEEPLPSSDSVEKVLAQSFSTISSNPQMSVREMRLFLAASGWDKIEDENGNHSTTNESVGNRAMVPREEESEEDLKAGYTWVRGHQRKLPAYSRSLNEAWEEYMLTERELMKERYDPDSLRKLDSMVAKAFMRVAMLPPDHPTRQGIANGDFGGLMDTPIVSSLQEWQLFDNESDVLPIADFGFNITPEAKTLYEQMGYDRPDASAVSGEITDPNFDEHNNIAKTYESLALDTLSDKSPSSDHLINQMSHVLNEREINNIDEELFTQSIGQTIQDLTGLLESSNPEHLDWRRRKDIELLRQRLSRFQYHRDEDANGGFSLVKDDGEVVERSELVATGFLPYESKGEKAHENINIYHHNSPPDSAKIKRLQAIATETARRKRWTEHRTGGIGANRSVRAKRLAAEFIYDKNQQGITPNLLQIRHHLNTKMRHGATTQQLGNLLSKDARFHHAGYERVGAMLSGDYNITTWQLTPPIEGE